MATNSLAGEVSTPTFQASGNVPTQPMPSQPSQPIGGTPAPAPGTALNPSTGSITAGSPLPVTDFGPIASVAPTYVNPIQAKQYMQQYLQYLKQAQAPGNKQQMQALNDSLAARGITSSGAAGQLQANLLGQQAAAYAQGASPIVSQGFGYAQQDTTGNAAAANNASLVNSQYYNQAVNTDAQDYNNYQTMLENQGYNTYTDLNNAYLQSYAPNPGVESAYGADLSGVLGAYSGIYDSALAGEGAAAGGIGQGLGTYFGDTAAAGGG
jgi:hypothetical protein